MDRKPSAMWEDHVAYTSLFLRNGLMRINASETGHWTVQVGSVEPAANGHVDLGKPWARADAAQWLESAQLSAEDALRTLLTDALEELDHG